MKFGKKIQNAAALSTAMCREDCWLDYKGMKKLLKSFERRATSEDMGEEKEREYDIKSSNDERRFFFMLKRELSKVTRVYLELERRQLGEFVSVLSTISQSKVTDEMSAKMLSRFTQLHGRLLLLKNFAVMNYVGFTKILKKHDKVTGFETRDKYMLNMVSDQPFTSHTTLKRALEVMETEYEYIKRQGSFLGGMSSKELDSFRAAIAPSQFYKTSAKQIQQVSSPKENKRRTHFNLTNSKQQKKPRQLPHVSEPVKMASNSLDSLVEAAVIRGRQTNNSAWC